ncbi:MAG: hypothetical protein MJ188_09875 [Treponema sp.]|nr:hypothetical protein [Treponema sp.]
MTDLYLSDNKTYIRVNKLFNLSDGKHMALVCETNDIHAEGYIKIGRKKLIIKSDWTNTDESKSTFFTAVNKDIKENENYFIEQRPDSSDELFQRV